MSSTTTVVLHLQYSTQWDTLAHVGALFDADGTGTAEPTFYNGYRGGIDIVGPTEAKEAGALPGTFVEAKGTSYAKALGVENMAVKCLQGRGVMIDLFAHFGRKRQPVGYDDLMRVMAADGVTVEAGDFVLLRTGFDEVVLEGNKTPDKERLQTSCAGLDGSDERLQQWVTETKLVALIADNYAVELLPTGLRPGRLRHAAPASALPVQDRRQSRRVLPPLGVGRLAPGQQPQPLPVHRTTAAAAGSRGLARNPGCNGLTAGVRKQRLRSNGRARLKLPQNSWQRNGS